jgi:hypothetical protein
MLGGQGFSQKHSYRRDELTAKGQHVVTRKLIIQHEIYVKTKNENAQSG